MVEHRAEVEAHIVFDRFRVLPRQRLVLEDGKPIRLGSRALDILLALLERPGERIGKAELLARAWPGLHVVEGNLKFQVAALRRALADGRDGRRFIEASKGQGYCFVAPVTVAEEGGPAAAPARHSRHDNLPEQLTPLVGRDEVVAKLASQLAMHHLLTIVGPGGIGKTSVALAVADRMLGAYQDGVWIVDLARLADPAQVRGAVACVLGLEAGPGLTTQALVTALRGRRMLLVLDNCMHLIDAVAELVAAVMRGAPEVRILATSREPLRCQGEHLCRLGPLDVPPPARIDAAAALRYPSVRLFVEQAQASLDGFALTDADAPVAAEVCRKLDGIPLAIELAAAWVGVLGLHGLAAQLDDRLRLLTGGRRTALPKHRTMRAALDWSHDLLSPPEQTVFRRLAVFAGGFTLGAAASVAADQSHPADEVVGITLELAAKSLVVPDLETPGPRFRLLQTTRAYALEKAREAGELESLGRRHAISLFELLESAARQGQHEGTGRLLEAAREIDNVRAALAWAFSAAGDPAIGVGLAAASLPVWFSISLMNEAHAWTERAIGALDAAVMQGTRQEMVLRTAHGISLQMVRGGTSDARAALDRALALAEQMQDADHRLHVLHTLWTHHMRIGEVGRALDRARQAEALAASMPDPDAAATATWMLGIAQHFAGEHRSAQRQLEQFLSAPPVHRGNHGICRAAFDPLNTARYVLAHVLWMLGCPQQAAQAVRLAVEDARRQGHPVTLCSVLAFGECALALRLGDLAVASRSAAEAVQIAESHALADQLSYARAALAIIALRKAGTHARRDQLEATIARWRAAQWHVVLTVGDFAETALEAGLFRLLSPVIEEALPRAERDQDLWAWPELLRLKGEVLLRQDSPDPRQARQCFERSLERARAQGALAWQLRTAASLHRLNLSQGGARRSCAVLSQTLAQFGEGFETIDLQAARQLLSQAPALRAPR